MIYYFVGICWMGFDEGVVLDMCFRLWGVEGLWVVDVLVMLKLISGNINVFIIMIVEKIVEMIKVDVWVQLYLLSV